MPDVVMVAARTPAELRARLAAGRWAATDLDLPCRVAVADPTPERIGNAREIVGLGTPWLGGGGIWFAPEPVPGRVAFLFPGLDARTGPWPDDVTDRFGLPRLPRHGDATVGGRTSDVLRVGRLLDTVLRRIGIVPDMVAGHSAGEWSAMFAAEVFPAACFEQFADRMGPGGFELPDLVFAAVALPADEVLRLVHGVEHVVVSHHNSPNQTVLCGAQDAVTTCLERITDPAVSRRVLPFRSGFHSPMLAPYLPAITAIFDDMPLQRPRLPIWSATTVAPYPRDETGTRELMTRHLLEPVRFSELVEEMYDAGARVFVQVGCGSLAGFVADVLGPRDHLAVSAGTRDRPYLTQLRHLAAATWAIGLRPDMAALEPESPVLAEYRTALAGVSASLDAVYLAWRAT